MPKVIFLDAGHGGINPAIGMYTTAPSKLFDHEKGNFHNGSTFYEGVKNRKICKMLQRKLVEAGVTVIPVYHDYLDTSLQARVDIANAYHKNIQEGIYISEHSNATPEHKARGFQVWTSPGQNSADGYADTLIEILTRSEVRPEAKIKILTDKTDGDGDYEARFFVLMQTAMPAVLLENLFFDNYSDATLLMMDTYIETYTDLLVMWIKMII